MKKSIFLIAFFVFMFNKTSVGRPGGYADFDYFYHSLSPHGEWISLDADLVVWRPNTVHMNWRPYTVGRWAWTTDGWYWDSYEPFGWATYHYGRWIYEDYYGWVWVPDYEWAPAWVEWRYNNNYIGWAPLPPYASFNVRLGIHFSINWRSHYNNWCFVSYNNFMNDRIYDHFVHQRNVSRFFSRTKYRTNYYERNNRIVHGGIDRRFVEKKAGYRIAERQINRVNSLEDYKRSRSSDKEKDLIRSYQPEGRELNRYEGKSVPVIRKGDRSTSIKRDKVTRSRDNMSRITERNSGEIKRSPVRTKDSATRPKASVERNQKTPSNDRNSKATQRSSNTDSRSSVKKSRTTESRKQKSVSEVKRTQRETVNNMTKKNSDTRLESKGRKAPSRNSSEKTSNTTRRR